MARMLTSLALLGCAQGLFLTPQPAQTGTQSLSASRRATLLGGAALFLPQLANADTTTASGLSYSVVKTGNGGGKPVVGDLIAIRFKGSVKATGAVFDDILASPEPYYTRVGSGNVLAGVEEAVKLMSSGDIWDLTIPGKLAFGEKGRSASPGKPRIPGNAEILFRLELVNVPGKDEEILEANGITE